MTFGVRSVDAGALPSLELINNVAGNHDTAKLHGNVMTLPINLASLANPRDISGEPIPPYIAPGASTISFWIEAYDRSGLTVDAVGHPRVPLRGDVLAPALTAFTSSGTLPARATKGTKLTVRMDPARAGSKPRLLLLHHLNTLGKKAQVVRVTR